jgi:uncharacterized protein YecE (DUF72 family)
MEAGRYQKGRLSMIKIGTSGFSFDDWKGPVYPSDIKKEDMLHYYERELGLNILEVNSTYYALPSQKSMESMSRKTSPEFKFAVKANKKMTHEIREKESNRLIDNKEVFEKFKYSIEPLINEGNLLCVLAQFPYSFYANKDNLEYLRVFKERMGNIELVIEFRNKYWHKDSVMKFLSDNDMGYCIVDEPKLPNLMPFVPLATSDIGYFRLHGRNTNWFNAPTSVRYDYVYTEEELLEFIEPIKKIADNTPMTLVFFNNCHAGSAVKNALMLIKMLS